MDGSIQFVLNGQRVEVASSDTHLMLLPYLRGMAGLSGTKEGCAEGDCGACTIVVGELIDDQIKYRAVNACILLLAQVNGREVITVEGLQDETGKLHPVQQALVDFHGSQCGFCTPGIVMSLYAHYRNQLPADRETLKDTLAGNLCRCTGYGPILSAGQAMYSYEEPVTVNTTSLLRELSNNKELAFHSKDQDSQILAPTGEKQLQEYLQEFPDATLWAGGTDTGLWLTKHMVRLGVIILLGEIKSLNFIEDTDEGIRIGATTKYVDAFDLLSQTWPAFGEVMRRTGSTQIRNTGTLGGNIANGSPIGDMAPMLIALGAKLQLGGPRGSREIPLENFFIAYGKQDLRAGEYVRSIFIPATAKALNFATWKISKRFDQDISAVLGAFSFIQTKEKLEQVRCCFGGMAATPKRAKATEAVLTGQPVTAALLAKAKTALAQDFEPLSDMRASATFRLQVAQALLEKAISGNTSIYLAKAGDAK